MQRSPPLPRLTLAMTLALASIMTELITPRCTVMPCELQHDGVSGR